MEVEGEEEEKNDAKENEVDDAQYGVNAYTYTTSVCVCEFLVLIRFRVQV